MADQFYSAGLPPTARRKHTLKLKLPPSPSQLSEMIRAGKEPPNRQERLVVETRHKPRYTPEKGLHHIPYAYPVRGNFRATQDPHPKRARKHKSEPTEVSEVYAKPVFRQRKFSEQKMAEIELRNRIVDRRLKEREELRKLLGIEP